MILITGGAGYIGSHVALNLLEQRKDILIFDNLENSELSVIESLKVINPQHIKFMEGDLKNTEDLKELFSENTIDSVIHFASYIRVEESVQNPSKYYTNNLIGTINLLNAMVDAKVSKIVFSSSAAVYGEPNYTPIDEDHPQRPINPYGKTKLMVEEILKDYDKAYNLKSICLRYFNVAGADSKNRIGECHNPETHLIPNILISAKDPQKTFSLFGNDYKTKDGTCIRDYVNIEDLANAHILALEYLDKNNQSDCFNIGTKSGSTVREVFETCQEVTNTTINVEVKSRRDGDPETLVADNSKAKRLLHWQPKKTLKDSITTAYKWITR